MTAAEQTRRICDWLSCNPGTPHRSDGDAIWVPPRSEAEFGVKVRPTESGFGDGLTVIFSVDEEPSGLFFDYEASDVDGPLRAVQLALSGQARLKVSRRGIAAHRVSVEVMRGGEWYEEQCAFSLLFPLWFWTRARVTYYRNQATVTAPLDVALKRA